MILIRFANVTHFSKGRVGEYKANQLLKGPSANTREEEQILKIIDNVSRAWSFFFG